MPGNRTSATSSDGLLSEIVSELRKKNPEEAVYAEGVRIASTPASKAPTPASKAPTTASKAPTSAPKAPTVATAAVPAVAAATAPTAAAAAKEPPLPSKSEAVKNIAAAVGLAAAAAAAATKTAPKTAGAKTGDAAPAAYKPYSAALRNRYGAPSATAYPSASAADPPPVITAPPVPSQPPVGATPAPTATTTVAPKVAPLSTAQKSGAPSSAAAAPPSRPTSAKPQTTPTGNAAKAKATPAKATPAVSAAKPALKAKTAGAKNASHVQSMQQKFDPSAKSKTPHSVAASSNSTAGGGAAKSKVNPKRWWSVCWLVIIFSLFRLIHEVQSSRRDVVRERNLLKSNQWNSHFYYWPRPSFYPTWLRPPHLATWLSALILRNETKWCMISISVCTLFFCHSVRLTNYTLLYMLVHPFSCFISLDHKEFKLLRENSVAIDKERVHFGHGACRTRTTFFVQVLLLPFNYL